MNHETPTLALAVLMAADAARRLEPVGPRELSDYSGLEHWAPRMVALHATVFGEVLPEPVKVVVDAAGAELDLAGCLYVRAHADRRAGHLPEQRRDYHRSTVAAELADIAAAVARGAAPHATLTEWGFQAAGVAVAG